MSIEALSLIAVVVALGAMMFLAYRGVSLLIVGPVVSVFVLLVSGMPVMDGLVTDYGGALGDFVAQNFLIFLSACVFGVMLSESGAAEDIASAMTRGVDRIKRGNKKFIVILLLTAVCAILTYGGVSAFVVVFTMVPLSKRIFKKYDIPWHLYMVVHSFGANLFTATMLPGSPAVQNLIPIPYLGTTPMAAPIMGLAVTVVSIALALVYAWYQLRRSARRAEGFLPTGDGINRSIEEEDAHAADTPTGGTGGGTVLLRTGTRLALLKALVAPAVVLIMMNGVGLDPVIALTLGILTSAVLYFRRFREGALVKALGTGAADGARTLVVVAAIVGFGGVVVAIPGYDFLVDGLDALPGSPLIQLVLAVNVVAAITGSASGGESIAFQAFGDKFVQLGFPPEVVHRVTAIACQGLDSLPHAGSVINQLQVARLTHGQAYKHIFVISGLIPLLGGFVAVACYYLGLV